METRARASKIRISPIRARITINQIRGKSVVDAKNILKNTNNKAARIIEKVLNSAVANATNNFDMKEENLFVTVARVDQGPTLKRHFFDSRSHIGHRDHRTSHITIYVGDKTEEKED